MADAGLIAKMLEDAIPAGDKLLADIEKAAVELSCLMAVAHGGEWRTKVDHEHHLVMVVGVRIGGRS